MHTRTHPLNHALVCVSLTCACLTGWRRLIGSPKLQIIFHKRAIKYRSLLRKMTYKDKGSYESSPPCTLICLCFQSLFLSCVSLACVSLACVSLACLRVHMQETPSRLPFQHAAPHRNVLLACLRHARNTLRCGASALEGVSLACLRHARDTLRCGAACWKGSRLGVSYMCTRRHARDTLRCGAVQHVARVGDYQRRHARDTLPCVAVRCSMLQCFAVFCRVLQGVAGMLRVLRCVAVCCSAL